MKSVKSAQVNIVISLDSSYRGEPNRFVCFCCSDNASPVVAAHQESPTLVLPVVLVPS